MMPHTHLGVEGGRPEVIHPKLCLSFMSPMNSKLRDTQRWQDLLALFLDSERQTEEPGFSSHRGTLGHLQNHFWSRGMFSGSDFYSPTSHFKAYFYVLRAGKWMRS